MAQVENIWAILDHMKISEIKDVLKVTILAGDDQLDKTIVAAGSADLMDDIFSSAAEGSVLLTGITTEQTIRAAKVSGVAVIVFVRGNKPKEDVLDLARSYNLPILLTHYSMFVASGRLYISGLRGLDGSW